MLSRKNPLSNLGGDGWLLIQRFQRLFRFYLYLAFVEHGAVKSEDVDEEVINGLALVFAEVVALVGQVDVTYLVLGSVEAIDALQIGELESGDTRGPVASVAHDKHGLGSYDSSQFGLAGASR